MTSYPHVALIVETSKQYDRGLFRGIGRYVKGHGPWSIYIEGAAHATRPRGGSATGRGTGSSLGSRTPRWPSVLSTGVPIVELRAAVDLELPTVYCDDDAIGDLAVRHFMERGFRHFAFCGRSGMGGASSASTPTAAGSRSSVMSAMTT